VLGISGRDGVFAEYLTLPAWNLRVVPDSIDDKTAAMIEPLAAACEIFEQVHMQPGTNVLLIGDGRLAQLIARLMSHMLCRVEVVGKSEQKVRRMKGNIARGFLNTQPPGKRYPVVIEASGSPRGWQTAINAIEPRGTLILKSTYTGDLKFNPASLVVNEITLVGSRCGRFAPAIAALQKGLTISDLIDGEFALDQWQEAFDFARRPETIKVLFKIGEK
jgi:threonine dehydrogenase-like Zn-dependent dehydrogenase